MNKIIFTFFLMLVFSGRIIAQDTFSIDAVDPVTGQVGSAGASCVANCLILSDVHPGRGIIHTQAYYLSQNQVYGRILMNAGLSPQQICDSLVAHDYQNNPTIRQYGIVDLIGGGRTAAYTGINCSDYKNHILGPTYTIQGNILLGQKVLDSMQARFLRTPGSLADKLMAALQGAKMIGADTRCTGSNKSSISSFLRVAKPGDTTGTLYLHLVVANTTGSNDPIDSLQVLYNQWLTTNVYNYSNIVPDRIALYQNYPNPFNPSTNIKFALTNRAFTSLKIYDTKGYEIAVLISDNLEAGTYNINWEPSGLSSGVYYYRLMSDNFVETKKLILLK